MSSTGPTRASVYTLTRCVFSCTGRRMACANISGSWRYPMRSSTGRCPESSHQWDFTDRRRTLDKWRATIYSHPIASWQDLKGTEWPIAARQSGSNDQPFGAIRYSAIVSSTSEESAGKSQITHVVLNEFRNSRKLDR